MLLEEFHLLKELDGFQCMFSRFVTISGLAIIQRITTRKERKRIYIIVFSADTDATRKNLVGLLDLANLNTQPHPPEFDPSQFAMTVQLNANFVRNSGTGKLVASAVPVHIGRRTVVVQTTVCDSDERLVATITTTMLVGLPGTH